MSGAELEPAPVDPAGAAVEQPVARMPAARVKARAALRPTDLLVWTMILSSDPRADPGMRASIVVDLCFHNRL
jgi:hypothetical protein